MTERTLSPCPSSPNCVSSLSDPEDKVHYLAPLSFEGEVADAQTRLKQIIVAMPRTRLVTEEEGYLHFVFTSALFRFDDDVELLLDAEAKAIHFRSASRVGYGDLGANRKRMKAIAGAWQTSPPPME